MIATNLVWVGTVFWHVDIDCRLKPLRHKGAVAERLRVLEPFIANQNGYAIAGKCADIGQNLVRI